MPSKFDYFNRMPYWQIDFGGFLIHLKAYFSIRIGATLKSKNLFPSKNKFFPLKVVPFTEDFTAWVSKNYCSKLAILLI